MGGDSNVSSKNETIQKSIVTIKELTADEKEKMKMEAQERYRRDMASALDFGKEQGLELRQVEIQSLKNTLKEKDNNFLQFQEKNAQLQAESLEKDERIRFLEEQLAKVNNKNL